MQDGRRHSRLRFAAAAVAYLETKWFTFAFLPIVPLARKKIRIVPSPRGGSGFHFQELGETSVEPHEVVVTYLTGWILWPAVLFGPFFVLMGPLGKEALAYVWIFGSSIAAMVLRDRRYRYQPDPKRERMVRSVRDVGAPARVALRDPERGGPFIVLAVRGPRAGFGHPRPAQDLPGDS